MAKPTGILVNQDEKTADFDIVDGPNLHQIMDVIGAPVREWCTRSVAFFTEIPVEIGSRRAKVTIGVHLVPVELSRIEEHRFNLRCASATFMQGIKFGKIDPTVPLVDISEYSTIHRSGKIRMKYELYVLLAEAFTG